ncbi:MAG: hypothetical protein JWO78_1230 [Micavibrio sp.]|nr:hypothetical protein [Micavibrio sp.]
MKFRWPHSYFKKHKRLPYLLIILIPALVYFVNQGHRYYEGRQVLRSLRAIHTPGDWYRYGADRNIREAQYNLALLYHRGFTVPQDDAEAARWLRRASDQDLALAQNELGTYYATGIGVPRDMTEAARLYTLAAAQGQLQSMNYLGELLLAGNGVTQDENAAMKWFEKAAMQGFIPAQINLARIYEQGHGVPSDLALSYAWISVADYSTDATPYQRPIDEISRRLMSPMDEATRLRARGMAKLYISQYGQRTRDLFMNILRQPASPAGANVIKPSQRP